MWRRRRRLRPLQQQQLQFVATEAAPWFLITSLLLPHPPPPPPPPPFRHRLARPTLDSGNALATSLRQNKRPADEGPGRAGRGVALGRSKEHDDGPRNWRPKRFGQPIWMSATQKRMQKDARNRNRTRNRNGTKETIAFVQVRHGPIQSLAM